MRTLETLEILGGAPCLDLSNTINSRREPVHDYLGQYLDLAEWSVRAGILATAKRDRLLRFSEGNPQEASDVLRRALEVRELMYRLFSNAVRGSRLNQTDMETFVAFYAEALSHMRLAKKGGYFAIDWSEDDALDSILWPIIHSAGQLLLSDELGRVKECPNCGWLFLDTSKNQSRRWCSMNTCGARDKMRRYHARLRKAK